MPSMSSIMSTAFKSVLPLTVCTGMGLYAFARIKLSQFRWSLESTVEKERLSSVVKSIQDLSSDLTLTFLSELRTKLDKPPQLKNDGRESKREKVQMLRGLQVYALERYILSLLYTPTLVLLSHLLTSLSLSIPPSQKAVLHSLAYYTLNQGYTKIQAMVNRIAEDVWHGGIGWIDEDQVNELETQLSDHVKAVILNLLQNLLPPEPQVVTTLAASGLTASHLEHLHSLKPKVDELYDIVESEWFEREVIRILQLTWESGWVKLRAEVAQSNPTSNSAMKSVKNQQGNTIPQIRPNGINRNGPEVHSPKINGLTNGVSTPTFHTPNSSPVPGSEDTAVQQRDQRSESSNEEDVTPRMRLTAFSKVLRRELPEVMKEDVVRRVGREGIGIVAIVLGEMDD